MDKISLCMIAELLLVNKTQKDHVGVNKGDEDDLHSHKQCST